MIALALALVAFALWPAVALAGDLAALRRAVATDDRAAMERWLAAEAKAPDEDPLTPLRSRAPGPELRGKAGALATQELAVGLMASAYLRHKNPDLKQKLLARLDAAIKAKQELGTEVRRAAAAPQPKPLVLARLVTVGQGRAGGEPEPVAEFAPDERTIRVLFTYRDATPGEELRSRWTRRDPAGAVEVATPTAKLQRAVGTGEFAFSPPTGGRWAEGPYRVEISGRGRMLADIDFRVGAPPGGAAVASAPPGPVASLPPPPPPGPGPAAGPVSVVDAVLARDIAEGQAKDPVTEFSTARKRLLLWARVQAPAGGALTARWYAVDGGERLLGEHALAVPAGESRVACWLEVANDQAKFTRGRYRVDLVAGDRVVRQLPFRVREAGFLEGLGEAIEQFGKELDKAIKGEGK